MSAEILTRLTKRLLPESEIPLERIPDAIRQRIWRAKSSEFGKVIAETNESLLKIGQQPLTEDEMEDAEEGNFVMNLSRE